MTRFGFLASFMTTYESNMTPLLTLTYWFQLQPPAMIPWIGTLLLVVFILFVITGVLAKVLFAGRMGDKLVRRAVERGGTVLLTMGIWGAYMSFVSYERIPLLSMRIWYIVWLAVSIWWGWTIYRYLKVEVPAKRAMQIERDRLNKWLPNAKK